MTSRTNVRWWLQHEKEMVYYYEHMAITYCFMARYTMFIQAFPKQVSFNAVKLHCVQTAHGPDKACKSLAAGEHVRS